MTALLVQSAALCASYGQSGSQNKAPNPQNKAPSPQPKGRIIAEEALIYKKDDFDAEILGQVHQGEVYDISPTTRGPFYKIRIKPGVVGWISDADIRPIGLSQNKEKKSKRNEKQKPTKIGNQRRKPFLVSRYRGIAIEYFQFIEDTMGTTRTEPMIFYGVNWSGYNTMFMGDIYTDANILLSFKSPKYYQDVTGKSSQGWILKMNFAFQTPSPQAKDILFYYGFGPTFTYSHFDVSLAEGARTVNYALEDMNLGAVFNVGLAFRVDRFSPRVSFKYYWEKKSTTGANLTLGMDF